MDLAAILKVKRYIYCSISISKAFSQNVVVLTRDSKFILCKQSFNVGSRLNTSYLYNSNEAFGLTSRSCEISKLFWDERFAEPQMLR
jgi:hypothetical protein